MKPADSCICSSGSPENYEGPLRECPVHGDGSEADGVEFLMKLTGAEYVDESLFERDQLPSYRVMLKGGRESNYAEMTLDAAEYELIQRLIAQFKKGSVWAPRLELHKRVKPGPLVFDSNFTDA